MFAELLTKYRERRSMSKKVLGELTGLDGGYFTGMENGHFPPPSTVTINKIIDALEINKNEIDQFVFFAAYERLNHSMKDEFKVFQEYRKDFLKENNKQNNMTIKGDCPYCEKPIDVILHDGDVNFMATASTKAKKV